MSFRVPVLQPELVEDRPTPVDHQEAPPASSRSAETACLVAIYGEDIGRRIELTRAAIVLGREPGEGVVIDEDTVSRRHAEISWSASGYRLRDLRSTNGTFVNDRQVVDFDLHHGDHVKLGRNIYKFLCGGGLEHDYHEVIHRLMTHDGLTQAHNRRHFDHTLGREAQRAQRYQRPLALVLFDIDHFKNVNDTLGHLAGDEILRQVAQAIHGRIRVEGVFARIGGEEFALVLPETNAASAALVADRLREGIAALRFEFEGRAWSITCSFGVAAFEPPAGGDIEQLFATADRRLYEAKRTGRNRTVSTG